MRKLGQQDADNLNGESSFVDSCGEYTLRVRGLREATQKARLEVEMQDDGPVVPSRRGASAEDIDMGVSARQREADRTRMY